MNRRLSLGLGLVLALVLASCSGAPADEPVMSVHFLDGPAGTIPANVITLVIDVYRVNAPPPPDGGVVMPDESQFTVSNLPTMDGARYAQRSKLPTGEPIRVVVIGQDMTGAPVYVGHIGPITLAAGERRFVDLAPYPVGMPQPLTSTVYPGGIFPTATPLPDGRVLVAGGFGAPTSMPCTGGEPSTTKCFVATAQRDAWVFAPADGLFRKITGGMLVARGGHTASALSNGQVLVAGGASALTIVVTPLGPDPTMPMGYSVDFRPRDAAGASTALSSFELFDASLNTIDDPTHEGDLGAGGFLGAADAPTTPGRMDSPRMLAAAAVVPRASGDLVMIAGGRGSPSTWELFDLHKPGGYGFYAGGGATALHTPRYYPSARTVGSGTTQSVWIVGGGDATGNTDLAEIWTPPTMAGGSGATTPATTKGYPSIDGMMAMDHPEYALFRPELGPVGVAATSGLLISGWAGPRCVVGASAPVPVWYDPAASSPQELCRQGVGPERGATVNLMTGATVDTSSGSPHAFGSSALLSDGKTFVLTGGFGSHMLTMQSQVDVFTGEVAMGRAVRASAHPSLARGRALHASAAIPGRGVLTVGGISVDVTTLNVALVTQAEALYFDVSQ